MVPCEQSVWSNFSPTQEFPHAEWPQPQTNLNDPKTDFCQFSCTYQFSIKRNKYFMQHVFFSNKTRLTHLMLNWMPFQLFWALQEEAITSSLENLLEELAVINPTEKNKQQTIIHYSVFLYSKLLKKSFLTSSVTSQQWSWTSRGYFLCWKCTFASHKS